MPTRTTDEVFQDHLSRRAAGDVVGNLAHNYAPDIVLLCTHGVFIGCDIRDGRIRVQTIHYTLVAKD